VAAKRPLTVIASLPVQALDPGRWLLTEKFVAGMREYVERWDAPVTAIMPLANQPTNNLDHVEVDASQLPFGLVVVPFDIAHVGEHLAASVVLGGPHYLLPGLSAYCSARGVPCVYNTEYSLRTRVQVARAETRNVVRLARRLQWEVLHEVRVRRELRRASAIQCNGTPTYDTYRHCTADPLLYFDSRTREHEMASDPELERANDARRAGQPLRLAFSGRLIEMKGAGDLTKIAVALRERSVAFSLRIFGGGTLEPQIRREIREHGLEECVVLEGVLDFHRELLPRMKGEVDLFVCCHPQGDPSCTYLETMAAGVPIIGYANEAFSGILRQADVGWSVPLGSVDRLADGIARLDRERGELASIASRALAFARQHSFESTFQRRIDHLNEVSSRHDRSNH